jgi:hypothetical protein
MAVFLQHICSEVNTLTGIVPSIWLLLSSPLPSGFSQTGLPPNTSLGKSHSLLFSTLPTQIVRDPLTDTPPLAPYRRFANASPGPAELATPSPRTSRIWMRVVVRRPHTTRRPGCGHDSQQSPRIWLAHYGIARYRRLSTLYELRNGHPVDLAATGSNLFLHRGVVHG